MDTALRIEPEEAKVVQMIFEMYGKQGMGYTAIAYTLNDMHIPTRKGGEWNIGSIVNILNNEVYLGKNRWGKEPVKRVIKDGMVAKKRIQNNDYELYEGRHEAIITQEQWDLVKAAHTQIIPAAQHILESYSILSLEEKNRLWKLVLKKVTIYRSPDNEITIRIHPNLPK